MASNFVRSVELLLIKPDGQTIGVLPLKGVFVQWHQEVAPIVTEAREQYGIDIIVLRKLSALEGGRSDGAIRYLAETNVQIETVPLLGQWSQGSELPAHMQLGGPGRDLAWAIRSLRIRNIKLLGRPVQIRTWMNCGLWLLPTDDGNIWLKVVPPFAVYEGALFSYLAQLPVPQVVAQHEGRMLMREVPGNDLWDANLGQLFSMIDLATNMHLRCVNQIDQFLHLGLVSWHSENQICCMTSVLKRLLSCLDRHGQFVLQDLIETIDERLALLMRCGIPLTLVHGDLHPGNFRGTPQSLALLDFADCAIGHPFFDLAHFLSRIRSPFRQKVKERCFNRWRQVFPTAEVDRAFELVQPICPLIQAVHLQRKLDINRHFRDQCRILPKAFLKKAISIANHNHLGRMQVEHRHSTSNAV